MISKTLYFTAFIACLYLFPASAPAQMTTQDDEAYEYALRQFINENLVQYGQDIISQERFLVEQMRLINSEIRSRVTDIDEVRDDYFAGLQTRLVELSALKSRIEATGNTSLVQFIEQLENRIRQTINEGRINYSRQKVFEDGLQLLYIAEEMMTLDPGSPVAGNAQISQKLATSQQQLMNTFGTESRTGVAREVTAGDITIFDLFREWKTTNTIKFELRWTDVQIVKNKLLRSGTSVDKDRMFENELRSAVMAFNFRNYDLAERLFAEIVTRYQFVPTLDDVWYYRGESNYLLARYKLAEESLLQLVRKYPTSPFAARAYSRLIRIADHHENNDKVREYFRAYEQVATAGDERYQENRFIVAQADISDGMYDQAVTLLTQIPSSSEFYIDGQYLLSQAYAGSGNLDDAARVLDGLITTYNLPPFDHFNMKLKLGLIHYERGNYHEAIRNFNDISGEYPLYDRVLIAYGWTYYKQEMAGPEDEPRDFSFAKKYLELLLDEYYGSDYLLEARSLLGYIYQLEEKTDEAINSFDYVFRARRLKDLSDQNLSQLEGVRARISQVDDQREAALASNDRSFFVSAQSRYIDLQDSLLRLNYSDLSSSSGAARSEMNRIQEQMAELERLKAIAAERKSPAMIERIEELEDRLRDSMNSYSLTSPDPRIGINYFDEYPVARKQSVIEHRNAKVQEMRNDIAQEQAYINQRLESIQNEIDRARGRKDYPRLVSLEIEKDRFQSLQKRFDQLMTYAYDLEVMDSDIDLQRWTDYGAFGIADVNYSVKQSKLEKRSYYLEQINKINQILNARKELLDHKINLIEGEINYMTRKVRRQERLRERAELDRKFEESYFDTHTTEFEAPETVPPVIDESQPGLEDEQPGIEEEQQDQE